MGLLDWLFGTKKKKKKKDTNKWAKQAESAKRNTQSNSKKGQRVSSNRPKATTAKPVSSSSRRGSYVSSATQKKAQTNATSIVKANREYTAYRKQAKKDEKAHDKKYGKTLLITPKGRNAKAFHDVNKGKATFAQNTKGNSKAYENVTSFYKQNKGEQDYAKKKVEEAYKHNAFGMGLKDSLRANFFGDDNTAKKVSERIGTKINADLNNEKYQSGKDTGLLLSYLAPGMAQGRIASGIMKGAKAVTKATQGAKAVATVGRAAPKLGKSVRMAGRARKLSAAHKVKKALKGTTKGQHFKAAMIADSMTSTPLNVSAAGAEARRVVDENKEQKQKLKAQSKEASKYLKDSKAAVAQYNKAISDVRNSSLPESEKKKYISNLKEERNKLIQSRRRVSDNKEQLDSQSKSISTSVNKEFGKKLLEYEGMDRLLGAGIAGFTARGQFKGAAKATVGNKAKVRKIALGKNLDKVKKIAKEDIAEEMEKAAKPTLTRGRSVKSAKGEVKGKTVVYKNKKTGKVIYEGSPKTPEQQRVVLRHAMNEAGGAKNLEVSTKDIGSPRARIRERNTIDVNKQLAKLDDTTASDFNLKRLRQAAGIEEDVGRKALDLSDTAQAQATSDLKETRQLMGATNKQKTQRAFKNAFKNQETPTVETPKQKTVKPVKDMTFEEASHARSRGEISEFDYLRRQQQDLYEKGLITKEQYDQGVKAFNETEQARHTDYRQWQREGKEVPEEYREDYERYIKERGNPTVKDIDNDIKSLQKRRDRMSKRKFDEEMSALEAERKEVKVREDAEAQKIKDKRDAKRIMRKPPKERTPDEVKTIVEDIENTPVAEINARIHRAETKMDRIYFRKVKHDMQRLFVDSGAAFENMARDAIKAGNEEEGRALYEATNSLRQTEKSVQYQIVDAQTDFNYHRIGESAHDITTPLKKRGKKIGKPMYEDTQELLFHMHNVDRMKQGKPVFSEYIDGLTSQKRIKEIRKKYSPKDRDFIDGQIEKVHEYFDNLRKLRRESGLISKELDEYLKELYPNYIPTKRMGDFERGISGDHNVVGAKDLQKAKGSNLDLLSLEDQMLRATNEVWTASKTNNLIQKVMALQDVKGKKLNLSELVDADGNPKTFEDIISESLFATGTEKGGYHLRWFDDGVAKSAECTKEVYDSLKALNGQGLNLPSWAKMVGDVTTGPANSIFKKLCTEWNPFFALYRNPMRDIQDALMYSKDFKGFIAHMPTAIKRMAKQDEYWQLWKASGGTQSSLFDITSQIKKSKNPLRRLGLVNNAVEQYPRFTEFCSILDNELKKAGKNGTPLPVSQATREMVDKASQAGADITVNFGRTGEITKLVNRYAVPFLNPGVQGVSKAVRLVTERSGAKAWIGLATKAAVLGFTPAVINEALLGDDKGYQRMNARDKLTNYIFKVGDNYIKIPKGRLLSLIGMGGMKMINPSYNWKEMRDVAMNQSAPANPFSDNLFMTAINAARNQTWYGGNIQSDYEESPKIDQTTVYDANTTDLAKWLSKTDFMKSIDAGKAKGLSPKKIDAMLKGYSGVLGEIGMPLMTQRARGGGLKGSLGRIFKKTFTIDPTYQNELSTKFYENEATAEREGTKEESKYFKDQSGRVSAINDIIRDVNASNRSYKEKNEIADALTQYKNRIMENANKGKKLPSDYKMKDLDAIADVMGKKYALDTVATNKTDKEIRKAYGNDEKFYDAYKTIKSTDATTKPSKAVALASVGADKKLYEAYGIDEEHQKIAKNYFKNGGSVQEIKKASEIVKGTGQDYMAKAMKLADNDAPDRLYSVYDIYENKMKAARVLTKAGWTSEQIENLKPKNSRKVDTDGSGRYSKAEVYNYVAKQKVSGNVKNALWSALAYKNMKPMFGSPTVPKESYKLKGANGSPKGGSSTASGKAGQVDYTTPEAREFMNNFGANMDKERRRVGEKLYRAAQSSVRGINAPYKNDKDYLPKETLQVVRSGDERLDADALKALKGGGIKALVKQAQKNLPKIKEPDDNTTFDDDGSSGGGGRGYYRRHGRRGHGRGGSGGSGSTGTATKKPEEIKTKDAKYNPSTWSPTAVSTDSGWTDAQIRKVYNTLIKQGLTQQQAVARIAQLWHTRFS